MNKFFLLIIRTYQYCLSPFLGAHCRFVPTCSQYCYECFQVFPFYKALWYSLRRLLKCHPFHTGGVDPLPVISTKARCGVKK